MLDYRGAVLRGVAVTLEKDAGRQPKGPLRLLSEEARRAPEIARRVESFRRQNVGVAGVPSKKALVENASTVVARSN